NDVDVGRSVNAVPDRSGLPNGMDDDDPRAPSDRWDARAAMRSSREGNRVSTAAVPTPQRRAPVLAPNAQQALARLAWATTNEENAEWISGGDWLRCSLLSDSSFYRAQEKLVKLGLVESKGSGRRTQYRLTPQGATYLQQ